MKRAAVTLLCVIGASITSQAHFVFVVPEPGRATATVSPIASAKTPSWPTATPHATATHSNP